MKPSHIPIPSFSPIISQTFLLVSLFFYQQLLQIFFSSSDVVLLYIRLFPLQDLNFSYLSVGSFLDGSTQPTFTPFIKIGQTSSNSILDVRVYTSRFFRPAILDDSLAFIQSSSPLLESHSSFFVVISNLRLPLSDPEKDTLWSDY